jgi:2-C-methyl-D-erythritol 4-phosphate cytidylyltransferase
MRYWLVMPAAGAGSRFGAATPKQYATLLGRSLIEWALAPFRADKRCRGIVVALAAADRYWPRLGLRDLATLRAVTGGAQRSQSVRCALTALASEAAAEDWVLVHDAARPCLSGEDLERLIGALAAHRIGGLLAVRAADTLKRAAAGAEPQAVEATVERAALWRALTPQMFRYGALCAALDAAHGAGRFPTDESQALEWQGEHPQLIEGSASNLKVTTADDLLLAAAILERQAARLKGTP